MSSIKTSLLKNTNKYDCDGCGQNAELKCIIYLSNPVWPTRPKQKYYICLSCYLDIHSQFLGILDEDIKRQEAKCNIQNT